MTRHPSFRSTASLAITLLAAACGAPNADSAAAADAPEAAEGPATAPSDTAEWITLFDGTDASAWRAYGGEELPAGWSVRDGALVRTGEAGDIVTRREFGNFELELEWRIAPCGNSGVFYYVVEADSLDYVWQSGPEMQVLDDACHPDGQRPETSAGSNFGLHAPAVDAVKPAGEWNRARIVARDGHVEHWLNGERVVAYELGSEDWRRRVAASKFASMPAYGRARRGRIALQDHGDLVAFRDIRIRELP